MSDFRQDQLAGLYGRINRSMPAGSQPWKDARYEARLEVLLDAVGVDRMCLPVGLLGTVEWLADEVDVETAGRVAALFDLARKAGR
jgi:hypothetical protein